MIHLPTSSPRSSFVSRLSRVSRVVCIGTLFSCLGWMPLHGAETVPIRQAEATVTLDAEAKLAQLLFTPDPVDPSVVPNHFPEGAVTLILQPSKDRLHLTYLVRRMEEGKWVQIDRGSLTFWPQERNRVARQVLDEAKVPMQTVDGQPIPIRLEREEGSLRLWLGGRLAVNVPLEGKGLAVRTEGTEPVVLTPRTPFEGGRQVALDFSHLHRALTAKGGDIKQVKVGGIPFELREGAFLSLKQAGWSEEKKDPSNFYENYDLGPAFDGDPRLPLVQAPKADYTEAWVLARYSGEEGTIPRFTLRAGTRGGSIADGGTTRQFYLQDFLAEIPTGKGPHNGLHLVKVPLSTLLAQDLSGDVLEIEMTREVRLARRMPDPNRFRWRPLGLPSGVEIAAMTLVKSPLQMRITPDAVGSLFELPAQPSYTIELTNITSEPQPYRLSFTLDGTEQTKAGNVPAGEKATFALPLSADQPGRYTVGIKLSDGKGALLLERETAFGILAKNTRKHRHQAPWGTWDFSGAHFTPRQAEVSGPLMQRLGLRYGMFNFTAAERAKYGVVKGNEMVIGPAMKEPERAAEIYQENKKKDPDLLPSILLFHENGISGEHLTRVPDLFAGREPYQLNAEEQAKFKELWQSVETGAKAMRAAYPEVKLHLGNGVHTLREELYRAKFPAELFDTGGNESMAGARPPEAQPPDGVAVNAGLWMDRQLLDAYGYGDKAVSLCFEVIYPSTNPGNLSYQTQADYFVRHLLHASAWEVPRIRPGHLSDMGNTYYHSNWGGIGFLTATPRLEPKPSALALATLTRLLDGAKYRDFRDTGSDSLFLMQFDRRDGVGIYPYWVARGSRPVTLEIVGATEVQQVSIDGKETRLPVEAGRLVVEATASPAWLCLPKGAKIGAITPGAPVHTAATTVAEPVELLPLETLDGWSLSTAANPLLDEYNPFSPRLFSPLKVEAASDSDGRRAIRVQLPEERPKRGPYDIRPLYRELIHAQGVPLPGKPAEIGLYVKGNSSWGRLIFELEDASGQIWTSIGARARGGSDWLADALGRTGSDAYRPGEQADWNTDDLFGLSRIDFDGWRFLSIPLPGQYPGGHVWPANSQWRSSLDGVVHYPLKLRKIVVELPERTLHLKRFEPARIPEIYLQKLSVVQRDQDAPKSVAERHVEAAQVDRR